VSNCVISPALGISLRFGNSFWFSWFSVMLSFCCVWTFAYLGDKCIEINSLYVCTSVLLSRAAIASLFYNIIKCSYPFTWNHKSDILTGWVVPLSPSRLSSPKYKVLLTENSFIDIDEVVPITSRLISLRVLWRNASYTVNVC
jgi:hypothetical protein